MAFMSAAAFLYFLDPANLPFFPSCPLHSLTGLYCPGCGASRAMHELLHGHWSAAFRLNPLAVSALPLMALSLVRRSTFRSPYWLWWALALVAIAFGVLRNIPAYPCTLLSPA